MYSRRRVAELPTAPEPGRGGRRVDRLPAVAGGGIAGASLAYAPAKAGVEGPPEGARRRSGAADAPSPTAQGRGPAPSAGRTRRSHRSRRLRLASPVSMPWWPCSRARSSHPRFRSIFVEGPDHGGVRTPSLPVLPDRTDLDCAANPDGGDPLGERDRCVLVFGLEDIEAAGRRVDAAHGPIGRDRLAVVHAHGRGVLPVTERVVRLHARCIHDVQILVEFGELLLGEPALLQTLPRLINHQHEFHDDLLVVSTPLFQLATDQRGDRKYGRWSRRRGHHDDGRTPSRWTAQRQEMCGRWRDRYLGTRSRRRPR